MISKAEFDRLTEQGYNRIPLVAKCYADLDTPLSVYLKLANARNTFLLESVVGGEQSGRYSFIGLPSETVLEVNGHTSQIVRTDESGEQVLEQQHNDPLGFIEQYHARFKIPKLPDMPRFFGGLAGYFGYDAVRYMEPSLEAGRKPDTLGTPDILLMQTDRLAVVDNIKGIIELVVFVDPASNPDAYQKGQNELDRLMDKLRASIPVPVSQSTGESEIDRSISKAQYLSMVEKAKEYIAQGDVMQVVLGQRLSKPFTADPLTLYRALRSLNPSPYLFYYNFGDFQVVGSSPEILVRQDQPSADTPPVVTLRPIAGTRPRGQTPAQDQELAEELLADPKEIAEHVMLIDLARNDLGRIAEVGSVRLTEKMIIERYSHVMHIVSNVEGLLNPGLSAMDVLRATFPAGTLSGAPKIRAMEIIDELEPTKRGVYGGACGYLSYNGNMDVAIAIRTGVVKGGTLYVQAGAGVVADSVPELEWQETENKARAVIRAAELAQAGLDGRLGGE